MRQGIYSSTIAIGAAVMMLVSAASAHVHGRAVASEMYGANSHSPDDLRPAVFGHLPCLPTRFGGGEAVHLARPSVSLDGGFPWIPVGTFDGFDAFEYRTLDLQTGQYAVFADGGAPTLTAAVSTVNSASKSSG